MSEWPGYWMHETSGVLRPIEAYLRGEPLNAIQVATMRAYLRQWIEAPCWGGGEYIDELRSRIHELTSREAIERWLGDAEASGIDPL